MFKYIKTRPTQPLTLYKVVQVKQVNKYILIKTLISTEFYALNGS